MSANQAAAKLNVHGVSHSTLKDRLKSRVTHGTKPGPPPYLDSREEKELVDYLSDTAKTGFGKTRQQIKCIAESVAKEKGILRSNHTLNGCWRRFLARQPKLALRHIDTTRLVCMDKSWLRCDEIPIFTAVLESLVQGYSA